MYFDALLLGAYMFNTSFWGTDSFIIMECPSLSPMIFLIFKSSLSEI